MSSQHRSLGKGLLLTQSGGHLSLPDSGFGSDLGRSNRPVSDLQPGLCSNALTLASACQAFQACSAFRGPHRALLPCSASPYSASLATLACLGVHQVGAPLPTRGSAWVAAYPREVRLRSVLGPLEPLPLGQAWQPEWLQGLPSCAACPFQPSPAQQPVC